MKKCPECGKIFRNLGAHMKAHRSKGVQETQKADAEENAQPQRPINRFGRVIFGGQAGVIRR